jgi:heterodisulfide reductase subunit B2
MKVTYYPGCSLEGTASDYAESLEAACSWLGVELSELEDWNCCGATAAHSIDHRASIALPGRNLSIAESAGLDMVVPCPLCFNRLKSAEKELLGDEGKSYNLSYSGKIQIYDLANFLAQDSMLDLIESKVTRPLEGLKAVCYYGCMSSRPPKVTDSTEHEDPTSMDRILERLGVEVKKWSYKTDCCGASHLIPRQDIVFTLAGNLYEKAVEAGANFIAVSCQMCQANLDMYQGKIVHQLGKPYYLPVLYFTELMGLAFGLKDVKNWLRKHFIEPTQLFERVGISA